MANLEKNPRLRAEKLTKAYKKNLVKLAKETVEDADQLEFEYDTVESLERLQKLNFALYQTFLHRDKLLNDVNKYYRPDIIKGNNEELLDRLNLLTELINLAAICRVEIIDFDRKYDFDTCALRDYIDNPPAD
jgi:hypothetical protein